MFVAKRMTPDPVTITPATSVSDAIQLLRTHQFRRLPVVDNGKLVGIVTDRDLREVSPSPATTLSVYELNYLLAKMQIKDVMKSPVQTIRDDATIEEAALVMYNDKIGGLVVVDANQKVAGIITETDIFKTFVDLMGLTEGKTRITINVTDKVGLLHEVTGVFKDLSVNIGSLVTYPLDNGHFQLVVRADIQEQDMPAIAKRLEAIQCPVVHVAYIR
ncbi:CBS and ACT domain-containing protein [Acetonema longum]|uniref:Signal-transduction protein n=1 Tax=Acetonema longum DSM 6540 TaxID=1009370 RepID=F7NIE6_9FIRM|nr:CBS and ACT domain-containing protein [Acetonema longum]EGO64176.1 signal-transduction protein [Acetonema longum DSM 6540]